MGESCISPEETAGCVAAETVAISAFWGALLAQGTRRVEVGLPSEKAVAGGLATRESEIDPEALALRDRFGDVRVAGDS